MTARDARKQGSYGKTTKVGVLWEGLRRLGTEVLAIPSAMLLARLLTPTEFGIAAAARLFVSLASRLGNLGFATALVRLKTLRPEHLSSVFVIGLTTGGIAAIVVTASAPSVGRFFGRPEVAEVLPVAALSFVIAPWGATAQVQLSRDFKFERLTAVAWTSVTVQAGVSVALAWLGFGFWSLVYGQLSGDLAGSVSTMILAKWKPSLRFSRAAISEIWSYGFAIQAKRILEFLAHNVDSLIVGRVLGITGLGLYDKAFDSVKRLAGRITVGHGVAFRVFGIIKDDPERFQRAYRKLALAIAIVVPPMFLSCVVVAPQLFLVLFGPQWSEAVPAFRILCCAVMLRALNGPATTTNEAVGLMWWQVLHRVIYFLLVAFGVLAGTRFGIEGAAWGVLFATVVLTLMIQFLLTRAVDLSWRQVTAPLAPGLLTSAGVVGSLVLVELTYRSVQPSPGALPLLAVQGLAGAFAYFALIVFSPFQSVRSLASETLIELVPSAAKRLGLSG